MAAHAARCRMLPPPRVCAQGTHTAMLSGMAAGEAAFRVLTLDEYTSKPEPPVPDIYEKAFQVGEQQRLHNWAQARAGHVLVCGVAAPVPGPSARRAEW